VRLADADWPCPEPLRACAALLVRPDDVRIGEPGEGAATLRVARRVFLGDRIQLHLAGAAAPLIAETHRDSPAAVGDAVGVRIAPERWMPGEAQV
jgi:putative spermidine/putrescine transport system ATP-binding protein